MLKLEELKPELHINGLLADRQVTIKAVDIAPDKDSAIIIYEYEDDAGLIAVGRAVLFRNQEKDISLASRDNFFSADPDVFKLAIEAKRIQWAYLFDPMMAVNSSVVTPLPHQITAVYEAMLPKQPLRFLLADDPGAGKTIMAGLLIKELIMRADAQRILIVAPGGLVGQWQDELLEKFGLTFEIFSRSKLADSATSNPFEQTGSWIARLDQLARTEPYDYRKLLTEIDWDLVIIDEAHKVAAHYSGNKVNKTKRFELAELLSQKTRHFLLMTATPHNGKEEDFQLFLSLLDPDRFYGKSDIKLGSDALQDIMRRMVKEDMRKFDGSRLFPERRAHTVPYSLSAAEHDLYSAVTDYVRNEMNRAERIVDASKKNIVGFALMLLQRRLASSPEAIYQSLLRRYERLDALRRECLQNPNTTTSFIINGKSDLPSPGSDADVDEDELTAEEREQFEEQAAQSVTAAKTIEELSAEIATLKSLKQQAFEICQSNKDSKWDNLSELLQSKSPDGKGPLMQNKLIIFTEHKDTLEYLKQKISQLNGKDDQVVVIHGGVDREDRHKIQEEFRNNPNVRYLIATDAAGEGINLQNTNYMINYDLPWNPNRIEQRFGRIHRIGQTEVCHLWNLVAKDTREGQVFERLLEKLNQQRDDLGDKVFDVLGELFASDMPLKTVLQESIRNDAISKRNFLLDRIDMALETSRIQTVLEQNALCQSDLGGDKLLSIKKQMDEAEARRLQPCYVSAFFRNALSFLHGAWISREFNRIQIKRIPMHLQQYKAQTREGLPVLKQISSSYVRVCFDKTEIQPVLPNGKQLPRAEFMHPGHPLMQALISEIGQQCQAAVSEGAILVDDLDDLSETPRLLTLIELGAKESNAQNRFAARQMLFLSVNHDGTVTDSGPAPHLDLRPMTQEEIALLDDHINSLGIFADSTIAKYRCAVETEAQRLNKIFFDATVQDRTKRITHAQRQIEDRLQAAISEYDSKIANILLRKDTNPKKLDPANLAKYQKAFQELVRRKQLRKQQLESEKKLLPMVPVLYGTALVVPKGFFLKLKGMPISAIDVAARKRVEHLAMQAVITAEKALGYEVIDCSKENKGWDIESLIPGTNSVRHIEVKGISKGKEMITISRNEWLQGFNLGDKFLLAYVIIDGEKCETPRYIRNPFHQPPEAVDTQKSIDLTKLDLLAKSAGTV